MRIPSLVDTTILSTPDFLRAASARGCSTAVGSGLSRAFAVPGHSRCRRRLDLVAGLLGGLVAGQQQQRQHRRGDERQHERQLEKEYLPGPRRCAHAAGNTGAATAIAVARPPRRTGGMTVSRTDGNVQKRPCPEYYWPTGDDQCAVRTNGSSDRNRPWGPGRREGGGLAAGRPVGRAAEQADGGQGRVPAGVHHRGSAGTMVPAEPLWFRSAPVVYPARHPRAPSAGVFTARTWLTPIRLRSKASADAAM